MNFKTIIFLLLIIFLCGCIFENTSNASITLFDTYTRTAYDNSEKILTKIDVLVTDKKGNPLPNKRVDWVIVDGDGSLVSSSTLTDSYHDNFHDIGVAGNFLVYNSLEKNIVLANVFGYDATIKITVVPKL